MNNNAKKAWYWKLHYQIFIAMFMAVPLGIIGGSEAVPYYGWAGDLFLRLLKMVVVPLILTSMVSGVSGIGDIRKLGKMGARTLTYYIVTSSLAILTGLLLVNLIKPGEGVDIILSSNPAEIGTTEFSLKNFLFRLIPENPFQDLVSSGGEIKQGPNILGVIFFSLLFGAFSTLLPEPGKSRIADLFDAAFKVMMKITDFVVKLAPIGVLALFAKVIGETGLSIIIPLLGYMITVFLGLCIHAFVTLPAILAIIGKYNPMVYLKALSSALAMAFSSASSNATLPLTMDCVENKANIPNKVSGFVLPLGATINMDGTALYECAAVIFIAQAYGIDLDITQQLIIFITSLLASIGAAGIPHAGLVMMSIILQAVGLPLEGVGLIVSVDRILDMCRTTVNVWSDSVGCAVVARFEQN